MYRDNADRKISINSLMLLSLILIVSFCMSSSLTLSSLMYPLSSPSSQLSLQQTFAQNGKGNGESNSKKLRVLPQALSARGSAIGVG